MSIAGATVTLQAMCRRVQRFNERDAALAREAALVANTSTVTANAVAELSVCSDVSLLSPPTHDTRAVAEPGTGSDMKSGGMVRKSEKNDVKTANALDEIPTWFDIIPNKINCTMQNQSFMLFSLFVIDSNCIAID